jgi:ribonuclease HI
MTGNLFGTPDPSATEGWFTAHCDGGSRGNPGPSGYGAVVEDANGRVAARLSQFLGIQTNNFAEYSGLLAVLQWATENGAKRLRVVSDSELMVKQMKGQYKVASPVLRPLYEQARRLAGRLEKFEMRHTLRGGNQEADRLANEAMDKGMGRSPAQQAAQAASRRVSDAPLKPQRQVFEGLVKNGVVHLIEGELPDGILVKVIRE